MPDRDEQELLNGNIKTTIKTTISSQEPVEIRRVIFENQGNQEEILEVTSYFEPVLSKKSKIMLIQYLIIYFNYKIR